MLTCQRPLFGLPAEVHYLNCAYMSPLSRPVVEAGIGGLRRKTTPWRIGPGDFFADAERARHLFARLVNAPDPSRIALIPAASYGLAAAARNTPVRRGQNIVVTHQQFPSNVYAWRRLATQAGAQLRTVEPPDGARRGAGWYARLLAAIDRDTAIVALGQVHWTDGTRFDLEAIGARAREVGAALIVDGTQSVGALPFDVQRLRPDALVCAAYKWLMGPYATGLAYFGPRYDDGVPLEETWMAREGSEDFRGLVLYQDAYRPGTARFDVGESSNFALLPALVAALEQVLEWQPDRIQDYCGRLTRSLIDEAQALGFGVEDASWRGAHLFGLRVPSGLDLVAVSTELEARQVFASLRGDVLRVSPHVYNDEADVAALSEALRAAVARTGAAR